MKKNRTTVGTETFSETYPVACLGDFKHQVLEWANSFEITCYLDHNGYGGYSNQSYDALVAVGAESELVLREEKGAFDQLKKYCDAHKQWLFGFLSYDLKNDVENLSSANFDGIGFPALHFFQPKFVLEIHKNFVTIHSRPGQPFRIYQTILQVPLSANDHYQPKVNNLVPRIRKKDYLGTVQAIRQHIRKGDIYEMNFCQEFYQEGVLLEAKNVFKKLNQLGKAPFSAFYKCNDRYLLCASPERFLKKEGNRLISQPIKGTARRGNDFKDDQLQRQQLFSSQKDRSENVMIVDLVRNDLSRSCQAGSVKVEELFGVYPFEQVYHLISTVVGDLKKDVHFIDAIRHAFPMGSMTGAPKVKSMELIEHYEQTKRGLYSGAVGYITPGGDFDFNVVIRSILYNAADQYLSTQVGGAIVYGSDPILEYEECLLKAKSMFNVLGVPTEVVDLQ